MQDLSPLHVTAAPPIGAGRPPRGQPGRRSLHDSAAGSPMKNEKLIRAWKNPEFRSTLNAAEVAPNPAGERLVEIGDAELREVWGGVYQGPVVSEGYVCTVSGESSGGVSCWS
ncbi:MAG: hypothetical protein JWM27_3441 [Gemmatimonadetes bacterium]|nr:hypothetical protein [Gemmatimonadota bacterium]